MVEYATDNFPVEKLPEVAAGWNVLIKPVHESVAKNAIPFSEGTELKQGDVIFVKKDGRTIMVTLKNPEKCDYDGSVNPQEEEYCIFGCDKYGKPGCPYGKK